MILEALKYMVLGMTVVFAFLYLLTLILEFQRKIIEKYFPEDKPPKQKPKSKKDKLKKVAAIAAAIHHKRTQNGN
ncbi:OadG family protein [Nautilia lithotrophica]